MKLSLPFKGQNVDISSLTAAPSDVRKGKKYIGSGSDDERIGEMERIVANLTAENIKYGVTVGEGEGAVTGTCQGFFD